MKLFLDYSLATEPYASLGDLLGVTCCNKIHGTQNIVLDLCVRQTAVVIWPCVIYTDQRNEGNMFLPLNVSSSTYCTIHT